MPNNNISSFPELTTLTDNDLFLIWDSGTASTKKIKALTLKAYFGTSQQQQTPTNISSFATATASTYYSSGYSPDKAIDGNLNTDWASAGQVNPWIQLDFSNPVTISRVRLADRPNSTDSANTGTLTFSNDTSIAVTGLENYGAIKTIDFPARAITWVRFTVTGGTGQNVGLSEFEVWGY